MVVIASSCICGRYIDDYFFGKAGGCDLDFHASYDSEANTDKYLPWGVPAPLTVAKPSRTKVGAPVFSRHNLTSGPTKWSQKWNFGELVYMLFQWHHRFCRVYAHSIDMLVGRKFKGLLRNACESPLVILLVFFVFLIECDGWWPKLVRQITSGLSTCISQQPLGIFGRPTYL